MPGAVKKPIGELPDRDRQHSRKFNDPTKLGSILRMARAKLSGKNSTLSQTKSRRNIAAITLHCGFFPDILVLTARHPWN